jgi:Cys-Gly metallodipeptidase DUG1
VKVEGESLHLLYGSLQTQLLTTWHGSIPVTLTFEQATGKNVLLLPMGSSTDAAHSINEKLDKRNYIEGIKLLGAYLHYVAEEPMDK